ncbi:MAG: acyltransferase [Shewanella sp.]|nr:acyltransferase [Shewanella sp.]
MSIRSNNFRDDINGLRAWAVVAVILYHFGITGFSGGFVGVDVFFVISGFLMTGIIVGELEKTSKIQGNAHFSLINFYISRARRIIPALLTLCIALIIAGWFFLSSLE